MSWSWPWDETLTWKRPHSFLSLCMYCVTAVHMPLCSVNWSESGVQYCMTSPVCTSSMTARVNGRCAGAISVRTGSSPTVDASMSAGYIQLSQRNDDHSHSGLQSTAAARSVLRSHHAMRSKCHVGALQSDGNATQVQIDS